MLTGLALLIAGGELLVRGAVQVATRLGVSPLVIGLTLVGFGTSMPELATSVQAALSGSSGIAYGNIVGSNIANVFLNLGLSALLAPIVIASRALKRDSTVMLAATVAFTILAAVGLIGRIVGACFVGALASYIYLAFRQEVGTKPGEHGAVYDKSFATQAGDPAMIPAVSMNAVGLSLLITLVGLALVLAGGYLLVEGAVELARANGISEAIIGLTIVAVGTSMPELVTSTMASLRRQADVAFGNIVGSNIYNILGISGATALTAPTEVPPQIVGFDNFVMVASSLLLLAVAFTGRRVARWEGGLLLAGYFVYVAWIWP